MSSENVMAISKIEGLLNEASKVMATLQPERRNQEDMKETAIEELLDYQRETIHVLRIVYED